MSHRPSIARRRARPGLESLEGRALRAAGFTEFPLPAPPAERFVQVHDIVTVSDDRVTFAATQYGPSDAKTGQPTYEGTATYQAIASAGSLAPLNPAGAASRSSIYGLVPGPDGNLWGIVNFAPARLNADGSITRFALAEGSYAQAIAPGPDGALYFTEPYRGLVANAAAGTVREAIGRITTDGKITEAVLPPNAAKPDQITRGPDGNLWFTLNDFGAGTATPGIGRITPSGIINQFALPDATTLPHAIAAGPDGNLWFTAQGIGKGSNPTVNTGSNYVGRITTAGAINLFPLPPQAERQKAGFVLGGITAGPDGNVWFAEPKSGQIARITPAGAVTEYAVPTADSAPTDITLGRDGALWFTELLGNKVGRYLPGPDLATQVTMAGAVAGTAFSGAVASLIDNTPGATTSYAAMIDWGDGTAPTPGAVVRNGARFDIVAAHAYARPGTYNVTVAAREVSGEGVTVTTPVPVRAGRLVSAQFVKAGRGPLRLALKFDGPVDPATAGSLARYTVASLGPKNRRGVQAVRAVRLKAAAFDPATNTVYLTPRGVVARRMATRVTIAGEGALTIAKA